MDKSLKFLGAKIQGTQKGCDDRLKKLLDEQNEVKGKLNALVKKDSASFLQKDLGDVIYEQKIGRQFFVNSHGSELMTTVLVAVNKKKVEHFQQNYLTILLNHYSNDFENWKKRTRDQIQSQAQLAEDKDHQQQIIDQEFKKQEEEYLKMSTQPGVVPASDKYLGVEDPDGNQLWRVTCMKSQVVDFIKVLKKNGYVGQQFAYDSDLYIENQKLLSKYQVDLNNLNIKIMNCCFYSFQELFQALLHLKIMRTYVDGVLRFGIPPRFMLGIVKPKRNQDAKIMQKLTTVFAEEHLKDMYGKKEDAQDEDFFPYVSYELTSPVFLMGN
mmetsp:Transcript_3322/g.5515  ORF Transcript_3322/g.5515 Transcript_3322/m.5515 type:complete len:326 (-) Transcript_3322:130-1107(-)